MPATIRRGDTSADVLACQIICHLAASQQLTCDGVFGAQTDAAVRNVQAISGKLTVDGVVGPKTWAVLLTLANQ